MGSEKAKRAAFDAAIKTRYGDLFAPPANLLPIPGKDMGNPQDGEGTLPFDEVATESPCIQPL